MVIPKITHQIWMQGWENIPEKFQKNVEVLHEKNPSYQHMKWDEESLRKECLKIGKKYAERFDSFELMISKVDFGRYAVLYNYGGVSVDTDMVSLRSIQETPHINDSDFIISYQTYPYNLLGLKNNAVIFCKVNHPILIDVMNTIVGDKRTRADFITKEYYVAYTTGPLMINQVVDKYKNSIKVIDHKYYEPCNSSDPYCKIPDETIMDHQHEMSWMNSYYKYFILILFYLLHHIYYIIAGIVGIILCYVFRNKIRKFKFGR